MKFLYADSLDYVDPNYDFLEDRSSPGRQPYWDDQFPHEFMGESPYDGLLVSRGIVGDHKFPGKYTQAQAMRFRRDGAATFFRLPAPLPPEFMLLGDCGAFSYADYEVPPYTPAEMLEFYGDGQFTHGCSVDHVIFDFDRKGLALQPLPDSERQAAVQLRFEITLENANAFIKEVRSTQIPLTPLGVVQGWSPGSMAYAAQKLERMGYSYLAIGGMVPLSAESIRAALSQIRQAIDPATRIHVLGFGKLDDMDMFADLGITSIDTTSPLLRAFKDNARNFFMLGADKKLDYYTAIRVPPAAENRAISTLVRRGFFKQERVAELERAALAALRDYDSGKIAADQALQVVMEYASTTKTNATNGAPPSPRQLSSLRAEYQRMLADAPWKKCECPVCQKDGIEVAIFRASNRNKRRGFHNIWIFNKQLKKLCKREELT